MAIVMGSAKGPKYDNGVVGPFVKSEVNPTFSYTRTWYRQKKPINYQKPLEFGYSRMGALPGNTHGDWKSWSRSVNFESFACNEAVKKARERLNVAINGVQGDFSGSAALGTTIAEWRQSHKMIERAATDMLRMTNYIRKGQFGLAWGVMKDRLPADANYSLNRRTGVATARISKEGVYRLHRGKPFANAYLEAHFGWSPLLQDIHDAVAVLQGNVPAHRVRSSATGEFREAGIFRSDPEVLWDYHVLEKYRCRMGAEVHISNPNLNLARHLGLINPASVAWEVVPFSFLVDWFVPVGDFLSQWTDFVGLNLAHEFTTLSGLLDDRSDYILRNPSAPWLAPEWRKNYRYRYEQTRKLGISNFQLKASRFTGLSATRGLTAVSLLVQSLKGNGKLPSP